MGGFGWERTPGFGDPDADWPGLGGLGEGWVGVTSSNPDWSESLSDSEIGRSLKMPGILSLLSQGIEFHRISHHGKFRYVGGLHPRTGIPWIPVCNR